MRPLPGPSARTRSKGTLQYRFARRGEADEVVQCDRAEGLGLIRVRGSDFWLLTRLETLRPQSLTHREYDAMAFEMWIGDRVRVADPGTWVYTPSSELRKGYHSPAAHGIGGVKDTELVGQAGEYWDRYGSVTHSFQGQATWCPQDQSLRLDIHQFGREFWREIRIFSDAIEVHGSWEPDSPPDIPPARGYGELVSDTTWLDFRELEAIAMNIEGVV